MLVIQIHLKSNVRYSDPPKVTNSFQCTEEEAATFKKNCLYFHPIFFTSFNPFFHIKCIFTVFIEICFILPAHSYMVLFHNDHIV